MSVKYEHYAKVKDKVCILYAGHCKDYVVLLKLVRPILEQSFEGMTVYLSCRDDFMYLLKDADHVISRTDLKEQHNHFGYVKEISGCMAGPHPIFMLLKESNIKVPVIAHQQTSPSSLCCIFTEGELPTKNMPKNQLDYFKDKASFDGFTVWVNPSVETVDQAGWVIGVEGAGLFAAAARGIRTTLVPTGIGTKLYQLMFPTGEIAENSDWMDR